MPTLSVAMIAKDEAEHLPGCLESLEGLADEICVVDTGSSDDTAPLARAAGCKVSHYPWNGDFSAARNASLDQCTGDWVLVIDADERIAAEDIPALRQQMTDRKVCYRLITRTYTNASNESDFSACTPGDPFARGFLGWTPSGKVRLFPNGAGARFEGAVHELVNASLEAAGIAIRTSDVPVHHYPFTRTPERLEEKRTLYLELGRTKVLAHPDDPKGHAELGNQYLELGDVASAIGAYQEAIRLAPGHAPYLGDLGSALAVAGQNDAAEQALVLAVEGDPALADAWRNLGVVRAQAGRWQDALSCFQKATELLPMNADGWRYLALALETEGNRAAASEAAEHAVACNPASPEAASLYAAQMVALGKRADAQSKIAGLIAAHGEVPALLQARDWLDVH